jgi:hypothetical protein
MVENKTDILNKRMYFDNPKFSNNHNKLVGRCICLRDFTL